MKYLLIAAFVAASAFGAAVYAAVDSAREPSGGHPDWLAEVFEHVINPEFPQPSNQKE